MLKDINECAADPDLCQDGDCINTEGGFRCECPRGYVLSQDGKTCIDIREELCFNTFRRGSCLDPRATTMTRTQCCCTMGGAWGSACEKCPSEGTRNCIFELWGKMESFGSTFWFSLMQRSLKNCVRADLDVDPRVRIWTNATSCQAYVKAANASILTDHSAANAQWASS